MKTAETGEKAWSTRMFTLGLPVKLVLLKSGEYVVRSLDQEVLEGEECLDVTLMRVWAQFISAEQNGQPCVVRLSRENCLLRSPKDVEDITDLETICSLGDQFGLKLDRSVAPDPKTVATVAELVRQSYSLEDPVMTAVQTVASQSLDVQESEKR
ncbi:MAG: hypothetical protein KGQ49_02570 [Verrucomicrobia bacterium]|nr:hypothetical protein [Verrucomicrobiota bacterium]MBU6446266.1 hypothetical protein [Verrucomicrobiota bacterium]